MTLVKRIENQNKPNYLVQKYGGSSLATPTKIKAVAKRIKKDLARCDGLVVVVSAMGDTTDHLLKLGRKMGKDMVVREVDRLLATGENESAPLLALALLNLGVPAISLTGHEAGIKTNQEHRVARVLAIVPEKVLQNLAEGRVVVVAGFQGSTENVEITTLGRGGSDISAVALAASLSVPCEIYTDVAGVFTTDPRIVPEAQVIEKITYAEMSELASSGARVMEPRSIEIGEIHDVPILVKKNRGTAPGTLIGRQKKGERVEVTGITSDKSVAKVTIVGVQDKPGIAETVFRPLAAASINVDIIVQNVSHHGVTDLSFTVKEDDLEKLRKLLPNLVKEVGAKRYETSAKIAKLSIIGSGFLNTPGVFVKAFSALAKEKINIQMISTGEIRLTLIVERKDLNRAVTVLHQVYRLEDL